MLRAVSTTERYGAGVVRFSAEFQAAAKMELEAMLSSPIFVQSSRCKRFLSYVVEQTLIGNAGQLKERTVGIAVFERANDYDTGDDSIVRVTANELRKRIGQFYGESAAIHPIQIELPRGSYVPEFRIRPSGKEEKPVQIPSSGPMEVGIETTVMTEQPTASGSRLSLDATRDEMLIGNLKSPAGITTRGIVFSVVVVLLVVGAAVLGVWRGGAATRVPDLWNSFSHASVPILVCIDTHNFERSTQEQRENGQRFVDLVLRRQIISLDDAAILAAVAGEFGRKGISFRVVGAEETSLADLRRQPVVLIGAIDNKWTIRLTRGLPYRIEVANPPGSGSNKEPIASIVDAQNPTAAPWTTDLSIPFPSWKNDYAVVARIDDTATGIPVLIEAGLGNSGTIAASELITSGGMTASLANQPSCRGKANFEAVIGTEIIDIKSGPPHVLRLTCW